MTGWKQQVNDNRGSVAVEANSGESGIDAVAEIQ